MADKQEQTAQMAQEKQQEAQRLFEKFAADNGLVFEIVVKAVDDPSTVTLRKAIKPEYAGQDWQVGIVAVFKNGR